MSPFDKDALDPVEKIKAAFVEILELISPGSNDDFDDLVNKFESYPIRDLLYLISDFSNIWVVMSKENVSDMSPKLINALLRNSLNETNANTSDMNFHKYICAGFVALLNRTYYDALILNHQDRHAVNNKIASFLAQLQIRSKKKERGIPVDKNTQHQKFIDPLRVIAIIIDRSVNDTGNYVFDISRVEKLIESISVGLPAEHFILNIDDNLSNFTIVTEKQVTVFHMLLELVQNARKYCLSNEAVQEMAVLNPDEQYDPWIAISVLLTDGAVEFRVKDNGIPISEDILVNIFNLDNSNPNTDNKEGLGVYSTQTGLREVHQAVLKLGGIILVNQANGVKEFVISLPLGCGVFDVPE